MLTGTLKSQIDRVWDAFWSGGIANPLEVIEQITYLLFIRRLDDLQTIEENKARRTGRPLDRQIFPADGGDVLRWSRFRDTDPTTMYETVSNGVFPFLRTLGGEGSTYSQHIPTPGFGPTCAG